MRPGNFFIIFRAVQYLPYIAIGLLVAAVAIWIVFGIKKFKWAKTLAIVLTVLVVITGLLSFTPYILGGFRGGQFPEDPQQLRDRQQRTESSSVEFDYSVYDYSLSDAVMIKAYILHNRLSI